jgi:hypothetical protein
MLPQISESFNPADIDQAVDPQTVQVILRYPSAQWHNGQKSQKRIGGVALTGGILIPAANVPEGISDIPGFTFDPNFVFPGGSEQPCFTATQAECAVIRDRRQWRQFNGMDSRGRRRYQSYPMTLPRQEGWRGHYQVLVVFRALPTLPFALSLSGTNSQAWSEAVLPHLDSYIARLRAVLNVKRLPRFGAWVTLRAGPHAVPNGDYTTETTPPELVIPEVITREEAIHNCFVGKDNLVTYTQWYHEAEAWVEAWSRRLTNDDEGEPAGVSAAAEEAF